MVLHKEGNVSAEVQIDLEKIVNMILVARDVVHPREAFVVVDFGVNLIRMLQQWLKRWQVNHMPSHK